MNYNISNKYNEHNIDNSLNQSFIETNSQTYGYKWHFICFIIWIIVIGIMIGYYYLK